MSVFNFNGSSQDSGSSTPPRVRGGDERTKKKKTERRKRKRVVRKQTRSSRIQRKEKMMRLEAVNQQWGLGEDDMQEDAENLVKQNEARSSKRVSFRCPSTNAEQDEVPQDEKQVLSSVQRCKSILKDMTEKTPELPQARSETPRPSPKSSKARDGSPQSTPKRPRLSPDQTTGRRRRSALSPNISPCSKISERTIEERKEKESSPGTGRSLSSPAHMKRNHKGETPLHLAAIKVGFLVAQDPCLCPCLIKEMKNREKVIKMSLFVTCRVTWR